MYSVRPRNQHPQQGVNFYEKSLLREIQQNKRLQKKELKLVQENLIKFKDDLNLKEKGKQGASKLLDKVSRLSDKINHEFFE